MVTFLSMALFDHGSISLYGITEGLLDKLQRAQNAAARHSSTHLRDIHWLPVRSRIKYKIFVTTYRALHNEDLPIRLF